MSGFGEASFSSMRFISNSKAIGGTSAQTVNIFQLTGSVLIRKIYGMIDTKTTLANMTAAHFALYDSSTTVVLTAATGTTMSTALPGAIVAKVAAAATAASVNLTAAGGLLEGTTDDCFFSFIVSQKNSANTYLRFNYTTTDNPVNIVMTFYVEYESINGGKLEIV